MRRMIFAVVLCLLGPTACSADVVAGHPLDRGPAAGEARFDDPVEAAEILRSARAAVTATTAYDYRDLAKARARALRTVTGAYRADYLRTFDGFLAGNARIQHVVVRTTISAAGLGPADSDGVSVAVFARLHLSKLRTPKQVRTFGLVVHLRPTGRSWLADQVRTSRTVHGEPAGTRSFRAALSTIRSGARAVLTFRRASFDADYRRALDATTGTLYAQLDSGRSSTLRRMTTGRFDLDVTIRGLTVVSARGDVVVAIVSVDTYRTMAGVRGTGPLARDLYMVAELRDGRWLLSYATDIGAD